MLDRNRKSIQGVVIDALEAWLQADTVSLSNTESIRLQGDTENIEGSTRTNPMPPSLGIADDTNNVVSSVIKKLSITVSNSGLSERAVATLPTVFSAIVDSLREATLSGSEIDHEDHQVPSSGNFEKVGDLPSETRRSRDAAAQRKTGTEPD